jgi:diguanylate cyclase (GGDEF)-like protein
MGLDRFKLINESMGHEAGNALLKAVANRLQKYPIDGDILARFGGDEFAFLHTNVSHEDIAALLAQDIIQDFTAPFVVHGQEMVVGLSIGITLCPLDHRNVTELFKDAQTAMHRAKAAGGKSYQFYSSEMTEKVKHRLSLESHLRRALEKQEFLLYYQPKVSTKTGKIAGAEALIRWQHPKRGLVAPTDFVSVLEDTGLIVPVGEWALEEICKQYSIWNSQGFGYLSLALNLSAKQFADHALYDKVRRTLDGMKPNPDFLELEVTESILMGDFESAAKTLADLHSLGIKLSIDDFGTGYSSLAYLKLLPVDILKIDRAFVIGLPDNVQDNAIVRLMKSVIIYRVIITADLFLVSNSLGY